MSGVADFVPDPSKLISASKVEELVTAAILTGDTPSAFTDVYCDQEGLYSDDRMEVDATVFVAWLVKCEEMGKRWNGK